MPGGGYHIARGVAEGDPSAGTREEVSHSGLDKAWYEGRQAFPEPQVLPQAPGAGSGRLSEEERSAHPSTPKPSGGKVNDLLFNDDQDTTEVPRIPRPPEAKHCPKVNVRRPVRFLTHSRHDFNCRQ